MSLRRQAKTFTKTQSEAILAYLAKTRHPDRNRVIFLLSTKAGLRAKEIASLTWDMVTDGDGAIGPAIRLEDKASKGLSGRVIPMNQRSSGSPDRMAQVAEGETFVFRRLDGASEGNQPAGSGKPVLSLVFQPGLRRMLQPQWSTDLYNERRA